MPPNLSVRPTPVLLSDQLNFTVPTGLPNFWIPDPSRQKIEKEAHQDKVGLIVFYLTALIWSLLGIYIVVTGNLQDRKRQAKRQVIEANSSDDELLVGFDSQGTTLEGSPDSALKTGSGTKALSPRTGVPRGLDRFRKFDDRWFRK